MKAPRLIVSLVKKNIAGDQKINQLNNVMKIAFVVTVFVCFSLGCGVAASIKNEIKECRFNGVVISKKKSLYGCFGEILLHQQDKKDTLINLCYCVSKSQDVWSFVLPNDSIYKEKESLQIIVIRSGKQIQFEFPICLR